MNTQNEEALIAEIERFKAEALKFTAAQAAQKISELYELLD